jgi:hypothetical protein
MRVWLVGIMGAAITAAMFLEGACALVKGEERARVAADFREQSECVARYDARAEIDACRAAVRARREDGGAR